MTSERKFYRTVVTIEVLSEEPVSFDHLSDVTDAIRYDCYGKIDFGISQEVDASTMAKLLYAAESPLYWIDKEVKTKK